MATTETLQTTSDQQERKAVDRWNIPALLKQHGLRYQHRSEYDNDQGPVICSSCRNPLGVLSTARVLVVAMARNWHCSSWSGVFSQLVGYIHDEVLTEVPSDSSETGVKQVQSITQQAMQRCTAGQAYSDQCQAG